MFRRSKLIFSVLLFAAVLLPLSGCLKQGIDPETARKMKPITLNYWRVWDGPDDFADIIARYMRLHPNITINYRKLRYEEYEDALIEAFATDRGPDIFSIHNTWVRGYQQRGLIQPMPDRVTMVYPEVKKGLKDEIVYNRRTSRTMSVSELEKLYVDVVANDVVLQEKNLETNVISDRIFGLPLSIDTLALFYNKDLFNNAGITNPPEYWNREFQQNVKKLTKQNNKGEIIQSGAGLGGSDNIERASDILSILMMQNGTIMMEGSQVKFHQQPPAFRNRDVNPGLDALRFYSDFSNPAKEVYSWNQTLDNSLELFIQNKLAMMFGYSYMLPQIRAQAPKLSFSIARLPQIEGNDRQINYANYWVEVVSKKAAASEEAWDFLLFAARAENVKTYLDRTQKPTALRSLVEQQLEDSVLEPFVSQLLTAQSWYRGADANAMEDIFKEMIDMAVVGKESYADIVGLAARKVQQTIAWQ